MSSRAARAGAGVPYELMVGLRYIRATRRERLLGLGSIVSMAGLGLGVWALIVVLSVVNGFRHEVQNKILGLTAHVQLVGAGGRMADWRAVAELAARDPRVVQTAPFIHGQAMLTGGQVVRGVLVRGVLPEAERRVVDIGEYMRSGSLSGLQPGARGVLLGADLARELGVGVGDRVGVLLPRPRANGDSPMPRLRAFTVAGVFEAGFAEADAALAIVHLADAQDAFGIGEAVSGVTLKLDDPFAARQVARELGGTLPAEVYTFDWTRSHANFFHNVEVSKRMMWTILVLIVLVAAINIVSTLVVAVAKRQGDIAILRALGASSASIMRIFIVHGVSIGLVGTLAGAAAGIVTALNIDVIVPALEHLFSVKFLSKDVYLIPELPSHLRTADVAAVALTALALSFLATLYPSWRAARVNPADALRYE